MQREYVRNQHAESLYLLRYMATSLVNILQGFSKNGKAVDQTDIFPIPELDPILIKKREEERRRFEERAEKVLEKYRKLGKKRGR